MDRPPGGRRVSRQPRRGPGRMGRGAPRRAHRPRPRSPCPRSPPSRLPGHPATRRRRPTGGGRRRAGDRGGEVPRGLPPWPPRRPGSATRGMPRPGSTRIGRCGRLRGPPKRRPTEHGAPGLRARRPAHGARPPRAIARGARRPSRACPGVRSMHRGDERGSDIGRREEVAKTSTTFEDLLTETAPQRPQECVGIPAADRHRRPRRRPRPSRIRARRSVPGRAGSWTAAGARRPGRCRSGRERRP